MNPTTMFIAASILLVAVGLVSWAWYAMAQAEGQLLTFSGFEAIHFEIGPQAIETSESARWPIPG